MIEDLCPYLPFAMNNQVDVPSGSTKDTPIHFVQLFQNTVISLIRIIG